MNLKHWTRLLGSSFITKHMGPFCYFSSAMYQESFHSTIKMELSDPQCSSTFSSWIYLMLKNRNHGRKIWENIMIFTLKMIRSFRRDLSSYLSKMFNRMNSDTNAVFLTDKTFACDAWVSGLGPGWSNCNPSPSNGLGKHHMMALSIAWIPTTHMGNQDEAPGFRLQPGPMPTVRPVNYWVEDLHHSHPFLLSSK